MQMKTHIGRPLTNSTLKATGVHFATRRVYNDKTRAIWREKRKLPLKKYNEGSGQNGCLFVWLKGVIMWNKNFPWSLEIKVFIVLWKTHYNFQNFYPVEKKTKSKQSYKNRFFCTYATFWNQTHKNIWTLDCHYMPFWKMKTKK